MTTVLGFCHRLYRCTLFVFIMAVLSAPASSSVATKPRNNMGGGDLTSDLPADYGPPCQNITQRSSLPDREMWRNRPVYFRATDGTVVLGSDGNDLPLGVPFHFETPLFKGTMLFRLRNAPTNDATGSHQAYFRGRKRVMETVVQGQFKQTLKMSDVYFGSVFSQPLAFPPPLSMQRVLNSVFKRIAPSVILDLTSSQPKVLALYAGSVQTMSVDPVGKQPDIMAVEIPENMKQVFKEKRGGIRNTPTYRKKVLSSPTKASEYVYDTEHVYTFHTYDDTMDYGSYSVKLPLLGPYKFGFALGKQPMTVSAVLKGGSPLFSFELWHEDVCGVDSDQIDGMKY
jgi:hypothetical protein